MIINSSDLPGLRAVFAQALKAVSGEHCVKDYLRKTTLTGDIFLLAIGKAACSMTKGAQSVLANRIRDSLIITRHGYCEPHISGVPVIEAGHPLPDGASIAAGSRLLSFIESVPRNATLLCLISGGASSLVEVLPGALTIDDLRHVNQWLLQSGLPIAEINAIRKQFSCIKGGRLAQRLRGRRTWVLLMSDVQSDDPAVIGSGLLFPTNAGLQPETTIKLPSHIRRMLSRAPDMPSATDACFGNIHWRIVANVSQAMDAASAAAKALGYATKTHHDYLGGDAVACGRRIAQKLQVEPGVFHIWGGETTVVLPQKPGIGGRCQSLALSAALAMRDFNNWCLLAAGTDGSDGVANVAGVSINAGSLANAERLLDGQAEQYLRDADAGTFFTASDDLLITGPTGSNVNDLVFGYRIGSS